MNEKVFRLSIDLGSQTTRILTAENAETTPYRLPTAFLRTEKPSSFIIGYRLLRPPYSRKLTWPLPRGTVDDPAACLTYLRILKRYVVPPGVTTWAVISTPSGGRSPDAKQLAQLASLAFDRALVVPGLTLTALALISRRAPFFRPATLLDLGATTYRAAVVEGCWPEPKEIVHLGPGGVRFDMELARTLSRQFPRINVHPLNARLLKERYAHVLPQPTVQPVQLTYNGHRRIADIGPAVFESCASMARIAAEAAKAALGPPQEEKAKKFSREIILTGGGAKCVGLAAGVAQELRAAGFPVKKVTVPENAQELVVRGGWQLATLLTPQHWESLEGARL